MFHLLILNMLPLPKTVPQLFMSVVQVRWRELIFLQWKASAINVTWFKVNAFLRTLLFLYMLNSLYNFFLVNQLL
jgi:hypothetical protein